MISYPPRAQTQESEVLFRAVNHRYLKNKRRLSYNPQWDICYYIYLRLKRRQQLDLLVNGLNMVIGGGDGGAQLVDDITKNTFE